MLAECSGVGIDIDLDAVPVPEGVALPRWLESFPSFGYLLAVGQENVRDSIARFAARDIVAADIGAVVAGSAVSVIRGPERRVVFDHAVTALLDMVEREQVA
jgi:hypothetical protein